MVSEQKIPTPRAQARQALKAALNGRDYGQRTDDISAVAGWWGDVILSKEAARLIDAMLTRAQDKGDNGDSA